MRSESRGPSGPDQAVASARVPAVVCARRQPHRRGHDGFRLYKIFTHFSEQSAPQLPRSLVQKVSWICGEICLPTCFRDAILLTAGPQLKRGTTRDNRTKSPPAESCQKKAGEPHAPAARALCAATRTAPDRTPDHPTKVSLAAPIAGRRRPHSRRRPHTLAD
eukprot:1939262-Prymnesium_polylepis.1